MKKWNKLKLLLKKFIKKIKSFFLIKIIDCMFEIEEEIEKIKRMKIFIEKHIFIIKQTSILISYLFFSYKIVKIMNKTERKDSFVYNFCIASFAFSIALLSYNSFFYFLSYKMNLIDFLNSFSTLVYWIILFIIFIIHFFNLKYLLYNSERMEWLKKDFKRYFLLIPEILLLFFPINHILIIS